MQEPQRNRNDLAANREGVPYPSTVIAWFSGTGGTEMVAKELQRQLTQRGDSVYLWPIEPNPENRQRLHGLKQSPVDRLYVLFPVYEFVAPQIVLDWCEDLPLYAHKAAVLSVSGGGDVGPNASSRLEVIRRLEEQNITVDYERMLIMPIHLNIPIAESLNQQLLRILPDKISHLVDALARGEVRRVDRPIDSVALPLRYLQATDACLFCGKCSAHCPTQNIEMARGGHPQFKDHCHMCLRCVYTCPVSAIVAPSFQKWLQDSGIQFNQVKTILGSESVKTPKGASNELVYKAIKDYLNEIEC